MNKISKEVLSLAYASSKERKQLNKKEREMVINEYINYTSNNLLDDGRNGKIFEIAIRGILQPNSIILKTQNQSYSDMTIKNKSTNKMVKIEIKTGGGELLRGLDWSSDWKNTILKNDIIELLENKFDYICYIVEYKKNTDVIKARFFTPKQYIDWLDSYYKGFKSMITYKIKENRLMISNPKASKKRIEFYNNICNDVMDIIEFNDKFKINKDL